MRLGAAPSSHMTRRSVFADVANNGQSFAPGVRGGGDGAAAQVRSMRAYAEWLWMDSKFSAATS